MLRLSAAGSPIPCAAANPMDSYSQANRPERPLKPAAESSAGLPRILAVTGGKGGVGKTSILLNLALVLAREGQRVLLLDGDTDLANVTIMLGRYPERTLAQVVTGQCELADVILSAPFGLDIVPGASGVQECLNLDTDQSLRVLKALARLERQYDYVLIDTAAGLQSVGLHMIAAAAMACVVITPDPTSLTDAFSLLKVMQRKGYRRTPSVVVNMARGASQAQAVFQRFQAAVRRHLGMSLHYLGAVWRDETIAQSIQHQRPVALLPESDPSCRQFLTLADILAVRFTQLPQRKSGIAAYWHRVSTRAREAEALTPPSPPAASGVVDPSVRCQQLVEELGRLLADHSESAMLQYDALNAVFALLGRVMDDDAIEIIQTGLASLDWEALTPPQRLHFARHLRQLAEQVEADVPLSQAAQALSQGAVEPHYDRISFGQPSQRSRMRQEQSSNPSLEQFLRSLSEKSGNPPS
ncbi:AAA family ATPase [Marinobacter sp. SS21]|uniref:AAA family ATPase n=1 Tax=Marinobacter sp. SS21 TaxID=2979460 RepID=UPI00232FA20E|nr:AAA family ATPase [Marinobacter sp. SS21]MDC0662657.1 AAA family ATPase [Marinobacter sp. SS21]